MKILWRKINSLAPIALCFSTFTLSSVFGSCDYAKAISQSRSVLGEMEKLSTQKPQSTVVQDLIDLGFADLINPEQAISPEVLEIIKDEITQREKMGDLITEVQYLNSLDQWPKSEIKAAAIAPTLASFTALVNTAKILKSSHTELSMQDVAKLILKADHEDLFCPNKGGIQSYPQALMTVKELIENEAMGLALRAASKAVMINMASSKCPSAPVQAANTSLQQIQELKQSALNSVQTEQSQKGMITKRPSKFYPYTRLKDYDSDEEYEYRKSGF